MCASAKDIHVTDTTTQPDPSAAEQPEQDAPKTSAPRRSAGGLGGKVLAELQEIASGLDISGASKMRKGELIDAIKAAQGQGATTPKAKPNGDSTQEPKG